ncbi:MAG: 2-dehydropantoate 2-reductase [Lentisphaerae bacterium]|nr:2-dehydropantoate 2-reductase [Lentisphaerota bacterium]
MPPRATPTQVVIVGPGAVGCLFAAALHRAGTSVALLDKDPVRARHLNESGLRIDPPPGGAPLCAFVPVSANPAELPRPAFLVLCVKAYDTGAAMRHARGLVAPETTVVSLQNGLGNAEQIRQILVSPALLCAVTGHGVTQLESGRVVHAGNGETYVAAGPDTPPGAADRFAALLEAAGFAARVRDDCTGMLWSKAVVNAAINPVTALNDIPNGAILEHAHLRDTAFAAAGEAAAVARARGIRLAYPDAAAEVERVCRQTAGNVSSMLQDVRRGRQTEIDAINGAVVRAADGAGIPVPTNRMLLRRLRERPAP